MTFLATAEETSNQQTCVIIGASHAGVTCAFELRKQGFAGRILLVDGGKHLPYHRPPLSKAYLSVPVGEPPPKLKSEAAYTKANIELLLGVNATYISTDKKMVYVKSISAPFEQRKLVFTHLVLATGATPIIPPVDGLNGCFEKARENTQNNVLVMRNADNAMALKALVNNPNKPIADFHAVVIGAGYIGLEAASSLRKAGAQVTVIERESRPLARVASEEVSQFVETLHRHQGVNVMCNEAVVSVAPSASQVTPKKEVTAQYDVVCNSGKRLLVDCILIGAGVCINTELAASANLQIEKRAIRVDGRMQTSNDIIWAIGDCTVFPHPEYGNDTHIESVQNALEQAKIAAKNVTLSTNQDTICRTGITPSAYCAIPWFWSDQFDIKLQIAGLMQSADTRILRIDSEHARSIWHFKGDTLCCVEAINSPKAYVLGSKWIAAHAVIDPQKLIDPSIDLTTLNSD